MDLPNVLFINCGKGFDSSAAMFQSHWAERLYNLWWIMQQYIVDVINTTYCDENHLMHLIRLLVFNVTKFNFGLRQSTFQKRKLS